MGGLRLKCILNEVDAPYESNFRKILRDGGAKRIVWLNVVVFKMSRTQCHVLAQPRTIFVAVIHDI